MPTGPPLLGCCHWVDVGQQMQRKGGGGHAGGGITCMRVIVRLSSGWGRPHPPPCLLVWAVLTTYLVCCIRSPHTSKPGGLGLMVSPGWPPRSAETLHGSSQERAKEQGHGWLAATRWCMHVRAQGLCHRQVFNTVSRPAGAPAPVLRVEPGKASRRLYRLHTSSIWVRRWAGHQRRVCSSAGLEAGWYTCVQVAEGRTQSM
jgi:hypothetical protein